MIKLEFPADRPDIAAVLGGALLRIAELGGAEVAVRSTTRAHAPAQSPTYDELEASNEMADRSHIEAKIPASEGGTAPDPEPKGVDQTTDPEPASAERDHNGVPFNADFCGQAADPFYGSGSRLGQWKKKRGVSEFDYDAWYRSEQAKLQGAETSDPAADERTVDTAAAFSGGQPEPQQPAAPKHVGELMVWVSERQAAGVLEQADVQAAYSEAGVDVGKLFGPQGIEYVPAVFQALQRRVKQ